MSTTGEPSAKTEDTPAQSSKTREGATQMGADAPQLKGRLEGWSFLFECIVTMCAFVGAIFIWLQLDEMKASNRITRESLEFTKRSAKENAADVTRSLEVAQRSASAAERAVGVLEESNRSTQTATRLAQRPWISVTNIGMEGINPRALEVRPPGEIVVTVGNTGRSPAIDVAIRSAATAGGRRFLGPTYGIAESPRGRGTIGVNVEVPVRATLRQFSAEDKNLVEASARTLYVFGRVDYKDVFGQQYYTTFCSYLNRAQSMSDRWKWDSCETYNEQK